MRLPIPKDMAIYTVHMALIDQSRKPNRYGEADTAGLFDEDIKNVLVNLSTSYTGTNSNRQLVSNGLIVLYGCWSSPIPELDKNSLGSKVTIDGHDYTMTTLNRFDEPYTHDLYSYEIEVL